MGRIDDNQEAMQVLIQHMLDELSPSPPNLVHLSSCFKQCYLRALWNGIFPQDVVTLIHNDRLTTHRIVSKIMVLYLQALYLLCIARCDLVHTSLPGGEQIEKLWLLREDM